MTWQQYGKKLEENLRDLSERLATGRYHARPVIRAGLGPTQERIRLLRAPSFLRAFVSKAGERQTQVSLSE